jgi:hypothetical protein
MQILDGSQLFTLSGQLSSLRGTVPIGVSPAGLPASGGAEVTTTLLRGTTTIGYVFTASGATAPASANATLGNGTLWLEAALLGSAFTSTPGFVGIPFVGATMQVSGSVTCSAGKIVLDAAATLTFNVTSPAVQSATPSGPLGGDFTAANLVPFPRALVNFLPASATITLQGAASETLYGQSLTFSPGTAPTADLLSNPTITFAAITCGVAQTTFTASASVSPEISFAGSAPVAGAGVVFPIYNLAPASLPPPVDAWGIVVAIGAGLSATIPTLPAPLFLAGASFALTPSRLIGLVANAYQRARYTYLLWTSPAPASPTPATQPPLALPRANITLDLGPGALISFFANPAEESVVSSGNLNAQLDRPVGADGMPLLLTGPALLTRTQTATAVTLDLGSLLTPTAVSSLSLMGENALLPLGTPDGFFLHGTIIPGQGSAPPSVTGQLAIAFPLVAVVPTFPDPYIASYAGAERAFLGQYSGAAAGITWAAGGPPTLSINLIKAPNAPAPGNVDTDRVIAVRLLDVSSNVDQWGVQLSLGGGGGLTFNGLCLEAPSGATTVFTVPGISWEPIVDATSAPAWLSASSPDDGTPTTFLVAVSTPAPLLADAALEMYQAGAATNATTAAFSLPFGIIANLRNQPTPNTTSPAFTLPKVSFPNATNPQLDLTGAQVLTITGASPAAEPALPGTALTGYSATQPQYGAQVLGTALPSVAQMWDEDFGPGDQGIIPISRIDLSGYGTSLFSDWSDPSPTDPGILRALFNVLLGRTAHEIITAQTWIMPWCIRLQRTITFDRSDGGDVVKHDTGWQAVGEGEFLLVASRQLAGPIQALRNVRNITFSNASFTVGADQYNDCVFDADVVFSPSVYIAANGKNFAANAPPAGAQNYVPPTAVGTGIQGYALDSVTIDPTTHKPVPPVAADVIALMQQVGVRVTGATGCIARIGGAGGEQFTMTVKSFGAALATGTTPMLQTALFGTPHLPKDGQWSVSQRLNGSSTPTSVSSSTPVPLTQGTSAGTTPPSSPGTFAATSFRLLDPEDAQSVATPKTFYGILQGTGTSKTLFEHALINSAGTGLGFNNQPVLADAGALLGIASVFPDLSSVLTIDTSGKGLPIATDGFKQTYQFPAAGAPAIPSRALLNLGIVHLSMNYGIPSGEAFTGELILDASVTPSKWSLALKNLAFIATVDGFGMLLTITGDFAAGSSTLPGVQNLNVTYGPSLSAIQGLLSGLSTLAKDLGGSAGLDVGFSGNTLSVQEGFTLPTIPLGFGEISNIGLDLGFSATIPSSLSFQVGIGSKTDPFQWIVSPLSGTGAIVLGVQNGGLDVYIEAGLGLGIALNVAVASGSASIVVSLALEIGPGQIQITAALVGNAQVDVLGGLASASLTLAAAIQITIEEAQSEAELGAQVSVGIHISICWVISVSFDGSWGFTQSIHI